MEPLKKGLKYLGFSDTEVMSQLGRLNNIILKKSALSIDQAAMSEAEITKILCDVTESAIDEYVNSITSGLDPAKKQEFYSIINI